MVNITRRRNDPQNHPLNRLFESAFGAWPMSGITGNQDALTGNWIPPVDVTEDQNEVTICAELPGIRPEDVKISLEDNLLTIRGEKQQREEQTSGKVHRYERSYGVFERSFTLPGTVDADRITATYDNGVLEVKLPKTEKAKPRQINVQIQAGQQSQQPK